MLTTQEKIDAWEKVLEEMCKSARRIGICTLAERQAIFHGMDFAKYRYLVDEIDVERDRRNDGYHSYLWPLNASGMASRRAFIQGKIDELKKELKGDRISL